MRVRLRQFLLILRTSAALVPIIALCSILYARIADGRFSPVYIFTANFAVGAFIILVGLVVFMLPIRFTKDKLLDHSNFTEKIPARKERKRVKAYEIMYTGMGVIVIAAVVQYLASLFPSP